MRAIGSQRYAGNPSPVEGAAAVAHHGIADVDNVSGDAATSAHDEYWELIVSLVTIWFGFIVIAGSGYVLAACLRWQGLEFDLSKPMLLWLPVAIVAATGPIWLPLAAWSEHRHRKLRVDILAEHEETGA